MARSVSRQKKILILVHLAQAFLHGITADLECKDDVIKEAKDNGDCNYFNSICQRMCEGYSSYASQCSFATDKFGKTKFIKDSCSCKCSGNKVKTPIGQTRPPIQTMPTMQTAASLNTFRNVILVNHNNYRKAHGSPILKINDQLNHFAQMRADMLAQMNGFITINPYGLAENLYYAYNTAPTSGEEAVKVWYDEIKDWNFKANAELQASLKTSHFAQVIWKSTSEIGIGRAYNYNTVYVVCFYYYGGNIMGQYGNNVLPRIA